MPADVVPACHNGEDSVTVSGPPELIDAFVKELSAEGIFAKKVLSSGVAFHSKYIADAGPKLRSSLEKVRPLTEDHCTDASWSDLQLLQINSNLSCF